LTVEQLQKGLKTFEKLDREGSGTIGIQEFYQLKEDMAPSLSSMLRNSQVDRVFAVRHLLTLKSRFVSQFSPFLLVESR